MPDLEPPIGGQRDLADAKRVGVDNAPILKGRAFIHAAGGGQIGRLVDHPEQARRLQVRFHHRKHLGGQRGGFGGGEIARDRDRHRLGHTLGDLDSERSRVLRGCGRQRDDGAQKRQRGAHGPRQARGLRQAHGGVRPGKGGCRKAR
jgi:hypothetical protein